MENVNELWLPVLGFEGSYEVSNMGNVRSLGRRVPTNMPGFHRVCPGKILKPQKAKRGGYLVVTLKKSKKIVCAKIHRLVAQAWIHNKYTLATVNHKDGDKANNTASNLEWMSMNDNLKHAREIGLTPRPYKGMNGHSVVAYASGGVFGIYPSIRVAAEMLGVCGQNISSHLMGKQKTVKGYTFKLAASAAN